MPRFFSTEVDLEAAVIRGEDARHLAKVLRIHPGESLTVSDLKGFDYRCQVTEVSPEAVFLKVLERRENETEPRLKITLYQALPKADKLEFIIQKAVEMGAWRIVPVVTKFCVAKMDKDAFLKKKGRYDKIALEAAKQCGRGILPEIGTVLSFTQAVEQMKGRPSLVFYEGGGNRISELISVQQQELSVFIGSEGGFSEQEITICEEAGIKCATLGKRILRCETAPIAALAVIHAAMGEL